MPAYDELRHVGDGALEDQETLRKITTDYALLSDCNPIILSNDDAVGNADVGISKWHMKGKCNIQSLTRRTMDVLDGNLSVTDSDHFNGSLDGLGYEKKRSVFKKGWERTSGQGFYDKDELNFSNEDEVLEKEMDKKLVGFGKQRYPFMLKSASRERVIGGISYSDEDSHEMFSSGWEADEPCHLNRRAYWAESDDCPDTPFVRPLNVEKNLLLVDVDLKVQASYQGENVPLVSLISRLNGKAIIGHPILIEILEDGSTDSLFPKNYLGVDTLGFDDRAAPPVWRTGRRTAMQRVPHTDLTPSALESEEAELDLDGKALFKEPYTAATHRTSSMKKSPHQCLPMMGKSHKKLLKKGNSTSQKTRTLSSLVTEHNKRTGKGAGAKHGRKNGSVLGGLIKPGSAVPLIACVPVKVVFSRILGAVGRPPSAGMARRGLPTRLAERNPS